MVYSDHFGTKPSEPVLHQVNGVVFETRVLHQTGVRLSDIKGGDLIYTMEGIKFGIVQYKSPDDNDIVKVDVPQLENLIKACPLPCQNKLAETHIKRLSGWCGSYYCARQNDKARYVPACEAHFKLGTKKSIPLNSFNSGMTKPVFEELFASCRIGAPTNFSSEVNYIIDRLCCMNSF